MIARLLCLAGLLAATVSLAADGPDLGRFVKAYPSDGKAKSFLAQPAVKQLWALIGPDAKKILASMDLEEPIERDGDLLVAQLASKLGPTGWYHATIVIGVSGAPGGVCLSSEETDDKGDPKQVWRSLARLAAIEGKGDCAGTAAELAAAFRKLPAD